MNASMEGIFQILTGEIIYKWAEKDLTHFFYANVISIRSAREFRFPVNTLVSYFYKLSDLNSRAYKQIAYSRSPTLSKFRAVCMLFGFLLLGILPPRGFDKIARVRK